METITDTKQQNNEVLASDILVAILVNLKRLSNKQQLFLKATYNTFQEIIPSLFLIFNNKFTKEYFVFSYSGPVPFCNSLQQAIENLQLSGMICWPDAQEPDLMRMNPSADDYYEKILTITSGKKLLHKDTVGVQRIAEEINSGWPELIVDRPYLMK